MKEQSFSLMLLSKFLAVGQCSGLGLGFGSGGGGGGGSPSMLAAGVMGREEGALVELKHLSPVGCLRWSVVGRGGSGETRLPPAGAISTTAILAPVS